MSDLIGKWVCFLGEDGEVHSGQITGRINEEVFLMHRQRPAEPEHTIMIDATFMCDHCGRAFASEAELLAWLAWASTHNAAEPLKSSPTRH